MRDVLAPVAFGWNYALDLGLGDLLANGVGIIAFVGKQRLDPVGNHLEQGDKTLRIVGLPRRQHETERPAFGVAPGAMVMLLCARAKIRAQPWPLRSPLVRMRVGRNGHLAFCLLFPYTKTMKKSISVYKKGPGRPATGQDTPVSTRLPESTLKAVEKWAERNDCTRSEAIRRLVELALKAKAARRPYSKKAADQAADLAERQIDRLGDQSATAEEKKSRKQRLLKGPPEFRGLWKKPSDPS